MPLVVAFLLFFMMPWSITADEEAVLKTVHHCDYDDDQRFTVFMATLLHQIEYYEENLIEHEVSIVANGACTRYISLKQKEEKLVKMIQSRAVNYGVKLYVCETGMKASGVQKAELIKEAQLVPNGSAKLTELQQQGFAYIKTY